MNDNRKAIVAHSQKIEQMQKKINEQDAELQTLRSMTETYKQLLDLASKRIEDQNMTIWPRAMIDKEGVKKII
jgi:hypothetical protein